VTRPGEAFVVREPTAAPVGVVVDSPHSGMEWPPDFQPVAPREGILTTWDAFVDELWAGAPGAGATLLAARFPRAYLDVNRAADDIDPELVDGVWPGPLRVSDYTRRGMGLVRRLALPGVPMYAGRSRWRRYRRRLDACYRRTAPRSVRHSSTARQARHGGVWHVNAHSMKSTGERHERGRGRATP
jgi:N-formylglutamate deformylase